MASSASLRFGPFDLRPAERLLCRDGEPLKLGGRAFDLLVALAERRDRVVSKNELMDIVWPRLVVEENNLQVQVLTLRKLLGPQVIATVPGRGYRFTAVPEDAPAPAAAAPAPSTTAQLPRLIGREHALSELVAAVRAQRLVTLLGAGGVGKSTLARCAVAALDAAFEDGVTWVDLTPLERPGAVVDTIASATRSTLARGDRLAALAAALRPLHALLVVDNAEHLVDAVTGVAQALHDAAPRLHLLVTSQAPLRLRAEQLLRLEPLALADPDAALADAMQSPAVQLFVERVRASDRHFVLDDLNRAAVVGLTRQLDGLPLAIEMAAARVPALSPTQLDDALRERFRVLTRGDPLAPARQHTLQAAMQWTHALLSEAERAVFRRLAVFVGGFSLPAAQQVCADDGIDEWQVLDTLVVLVDRSLVTLPAGDPPRYRLLDTPQAFARQQLASAGEEAATRRRHLDFFRRFYAEGYEAHLWRRNPVVQWLAAWGPDADNGLAALAHGIVHDRVAALAIVPGLAQTLVRRHAERFDCWRRTEPLLDASVPDEVRARWQLGYAQFWGVNSREQRSRPAALAAATHFRRIGHAAGEYRAQAMLATTVSGSTDDGVEAALQRLRELEQPQWSGDLRFLRRWAEAAWLSTAGRHDEALAAGRDCLALIEESGRGGRLIHEMGMMFVEIMAGRLDDAIARGQAAVQRMRVHQRHAPASGAELLLLAAWLLRGDLVEARALGRAVWDAGAMFNQKAAVAETLSLLAASEGRPRSAVLLVGYADAEYTRSGTNRLAVYRLCGDRAEVLAARSLPAAGRAALKARGATWADGSVPTLAFGTADLQPEIS